MWDADMDGRDALRRVLLRTTTGRERLHAHGQLVGHVVGVEARWGEPVMQLVHDPLEYDADEHPEEEA